MELTVQNAERADHLRCGIGEQWISDAFALGEGLQNGDGVVAERGDGESALPVSILLLFQLDELGFAERSPVGGTHEQKRQAVRAAQVFEGAGLGGLIDGREVRNGGANRRTGLNLLRLERQQYG
jgi:hypothetical protein